MDWSGDMADKIGTDEYGEILIYQTDDGQTNIEVKIEDDTVWLTQQQLTELYQCSKSNISEHIKHIFEEGQLDSVLSSGNRKLLTGAGSVSHKQALEKAKAEYRKYQEITLTPVEKAYLESIKEVSKEVKRR